MIFKENNQASSEKAECSLHDSELEFNKKIAFTVVAAKMCF